MLDVEQQPAAREAQDAPPETQLEEERVVAEPTLDRAIEIGRINGEVLAWAGVILLAAALRLVSLGTGALSVDGARHAYAGYALFRGLGTALDSGAGGPFAVILSAALFFLFGVSDEIARLGPALAGTAMVAVVALARPYLGRYGALLAGLLVAISPTLTYFSRNTQTDIYAAFFATLLYVALLRVCDRGRAGDLILATVAAALLVVSAPVGTTLLLIFAGALAVIWVRSRAASPSPAAPARGKRAVPAAPVEPPFGAAGLATATRAGGLVALLAAAVILLLVFSAFGAVPGNLASGPADWLGAWTGSLFGPSPSVPGRDAAFALSLVLLYEPLALVAGLWGAVRLVRGGETARGGWAARAVLAGWAVVGLALLAVGGGQQPALVLVPVLPLILLAGATLGDLVEEIDWQPGGTFWRGGTAVILFAALALAALGALIGQLLRPSAVLDDTQRFLSLAITLLGFLVPLVAAALYYARRIEAAPALRALVVGATIFLLGYGLRSAVGLSIYRYNVASEPLVYDASTPEVRPLMDRILKLSRDATALNRTIADPTGGHGLSVAVYPQVEWPVRWYLRDFPDLRVANFGAPNAGIGQPQLVFRPADNSPAPVAGYYEVPYKLRWSYPAGQPLTGGDSGLLKVLGFLIFRNNVAPAPSADLLVDYGPDLAQRLFLPAQSAGPYNLSDRVGAGKAPGQFDSPRGVAVGPDGSIYVVDMRNARIEQFARDGSFVRQFGSLGHDDGQLWREAGRGPTGIAVGADGSVYVADTWNYRIVKFTADGQFVTKWGSFINLVAGEQGGDRTTGLYGPRGIALGPNGDVYVTDTGNGRVVVYGPDGTFRREFGSKGQGPNQLDEPVGIVVSADGSRVYVADSNNARISVFDSQGKPVAQWLVEPWRGKSFFEPYLALGSDGSIYATSSATRQILKFNADGQQIATATGGTNPDDALSTPFGVAVAADGAIFVTDGGKHFVLQLTGMPSR